MHFDHLTARTRCERLQRKVFYYFENFTSNIWNEIVRIFYKTKNLSTQELIKWKRGMK